jgi:hypothetical protein
VTSRQQPPNREERGDTPRGSICGAASSPLVQTSVLRQLFTLLFPKRLVQSIMAELSEDNEFISVVQAVTLIPRNFEGDSKQRECCQNVEAAI